LGFSPFSFYFFATKLIVLSQFKDYGKIFYIKENNMHAQCKVRIVGKTLLTQDFSRACTSQRIKKREVLSAMARSGFSRIYDSIRRLRNICAAFAAYGV
jgi:hypothetical protein